MTISPKFSAPYDQLQSLDYQDVFSFNVSLLLEQLSERDPEIAADIQLIVDQALKVKKVYNLVGADGKLDHDAYQNGFEASKSAETKLNQLCEDIYKKYETEPAQRRSLLIASYTKITNMLVASKLQTRENVFDVLRDLRDQSAESGTLDPDVELAGFIESILWPFKQRENQGWTRDNRTYVFNKIDDAIDVINQVVFEPVLTAHPTLMDTLDAVLRLREINDAGREMVMKGAAFAEQSIQRLKQALGNWLDVQLTPEDKQGLPRSFTPFEEIDHEQEALKAIFYNMAGVRRTIDAAFLRRAKFRTDVPDMYTPEKRLRLKMDFRPKSWVMGDKDGNTNSKAEHLLYSVVVRRLTALQIYKEEIAKLATKNVALPASEYGAWPDIFARGEAVLLKAKARLDVNKRDIDLELTQSEFDAINDMSAKALRSTKHPLDFETVAQFFSRDLEKAYWDNPSHQDDLIVLIDGVRSFQLNMGALELRETSVEYGRILNSLITENPFEDNTPIRYLDLSEMEKLRFLDRLIIEKPEYLARQTKAFLEKIEATDHLRNYDEGHPEVIAYHTLKRLMVAVANQDAVKDMVLAEFQNSSNILEALALQVAVGKVSGKPLDMPVSPLFEEFDTLENSNEKIWGALQSKAYRQHLWQQAGGDPSKLRIKVQAAHSDNIRRSGSPAGRAGVYALHHDLPEFLKEHSSDIARLFQSDGLETSGLSIYVEWFEGKSSTDTSRGGGRAQSAMINAYELHPHTKETYQGFDIHYFLVFPQAFIRMVARLFSNNSKELAIQKRDKKTSSIQSFAAMEDAVVSALKKTFSDYTHHHFDANVGRLFPYPLWDAERNKMLANRGSRNAARGKAQKAVIYDFEETSKVSTDNIRSIPYGNSLADAELHVAMLGAGNIRKYLAETFIPGSKALKELEFEARRFGYEAPMGIGDEQQTQFTTQGLQTLYRASPVFRDAIDFIGNGLIHSNLEKQRQRFNKGIKSGIIPTREMFIYTGDVLPRDYAAGAKLVLAAFGHDLPLELERAMASDKPMSASECSQLRFLLENLAFPNLQPETQLNEVLGAFLKTANDNIVTHAWRAGRKHFTEYDVHELRDLSNIASGTLALRHGRIFAAEDPKYASYLDRLKRKRSGQEPGMA